MQKSFFEDKKILVKFHLYILFDRLLLGGVLLQYKLKKLTKNAFMYGGSKN